MHRLSRRSFSGILRSAATRYRPLSSPFPVDHLLLSRESNTTKRWCSMLRAGSSKGIGDTMLFNLKKESTVAASATTEIYEYPPEVSHLMDLIVNCSHRNKEVFLEELHKNAEKALRTMRSLLVAKPQQNATTALDIHIRTDKDNGIITITDTGTGMTWQELVDCLVGTFAQSEVAKVLMAMKDRKKANDFVGGCGWGFYSAFIVSERVEVSTKSPKSDKQYLWEGEANSRSYTIREETDPAKLIPRGTRVTLYLKPDEKGYAHLERIQKFAQLQGFCCDFPIYIWQRNRYVKLTRHLSSIHLLARASPWIGYRQFFSSQSYLDKISLDEYVENIKPEQKNIYYIAADSVASAKSTPILKKFIEKDIEVLFVVDDPKDKAAIQNQKLYMDKIFVEVNKENLDLGLIPEIAATAEDVEEKPFPKIAAREREFTEEAIVIEESDEAPKMKSGYSGSTVSGRKKMSKDEMVARVEHKRLVTGDDKDPATKTQKKVKDGVTFAAEETPPKALTLEFPTSYLQNGDVESVWPQANQLLFPAAEAFMNNASNKDIVDKIVASNLQCLQYSLFLHKRLEVGDNEIRRLKLQLAQADESEMLLRKKLNAIKDDMKRAREEVARAEKLREVATSQNAIKDEEQESARLKADVADLNSRVLSLTEEVKDIESPYTIKTRLKQDIDGKAGHSSSQKEVKDLWASLRAAAHLI